MSSPIQPLKILQVSTADVAGGAEKVALSLHRSYQAQHQLSWLAVGELRGDEPDVLRIPNEASRHPWARGWRALGWQIQHAAGRGKWARAVRRFLNGVGEPGRALEMELGREDLAFPGTWRLLDLPPQRPTILHCHNLHGGYFDLRALPSLSRAVPTLLTLHDAWLLSGHCAHSLECQRWETGCGSCPDLTLYPAVPRDATAFNWRRKRDLFAKSRLYVSTPSQWLMDRVERSMIAPGVIERRVIPNGVDRTVFHPGDRGTARLGLDIPMDADVLLFAAHGIHSNPWKDFETMRTALGQVATALHERRVLLLALGEEAPTEFVGGAELRYVRHQPDPAVTASYYRAADVYVHAARADTFPNSVLEALASGTPVVATAIGGIPEQVRDAATGFLVPPGSPTWMAEAIVTLLRDDQLRRGMSLRAAEEAEARFDLKRQAHDYLDWYQDILNAPPPPNWESTHPASH